MSDHGHGWTWIPAATQTAADAQWERVEVIVRAAVVASLSEAEFIRRLRAAGLAVWAGGLDGHGGALNYLVEASPGSGDTRTDCGVAADLALEIVRDQFEPGPVTAGQAREQWRDVRAPGVFDRDRILLSHPVMWSRMFSDAAQFTYALRGVPPARAASQWAWAAARLAGAFAAWSIRTEAGLDGPFATAAWQLRWSAAGLRASGDPVVARRRRTGPNLGRVAYGLTHLEPAADDPNHTLPLVIQLCGALFELGKAHRRRGETDHAAALDRAANGLNPICQQLHAQALALRDATHRDPR